MYTHKKYQSYEHAAFKEKIIMAYVQLKNYKICFKYYIFKNNAFNISWESFE